MGGWLKEGFLGYGSENTKEIFFLIYIYNI